jgi:class 3 adenylate cyclase
MDGIVAFNHAHGTELGLHIGINTGLVVAGEIGGRDRRDHSVMGDAVNLAARLEDASRLCLQGTVAATNLFFRVAGIPNPPGQPG